MSGDRRERELDAFLERDGGELGGLYRKLPRAEPSRRLDRAILAEAVRAVRGADGRRRPRQRWLLGLGSVAGVVLAAGIAWQVQRETVPAAAPMSESASPPGVIPVEPIVPPPPAPILSPPPAPATQAAPATAAPPAAPARRERAASAAKETPPRAERQAAAPPPAASARSDAAAPAEAEVPQAPPAAAPAAAPPPAPAPAEHAAPARSGVGTSPAPITSTELRRNMRLPPQVWLDEIRRLQREGQHHWAGENLRLYRRVHPRRAIPADLEPLLDD